MGPRIILDRFLRGGEPSPELKAALADLDRLARERPDLESPSRSLARLLDLAFRIPEPSAVEPPDLDRLTEGWSCGVPSFRSCPPRLDPSALARRARVLFRAIGGEDASSFLRTIRERRIDLSWIAAEVVAGRRHEVERTAAEVGLRPDLLGSILGLAMLPGLAPVSSAYDQVRPDGVWARGDCPNCGGRPLLAESRGLERRVSLRCGLCAGDWPGDRLGCPCCGESRPKALESLYVEGEQERYRLARCSSCSSYWKVVATLTPLSPPALLVAELATFHLDVLGRESAES